MPAANYLGSPLDFATSVHRTWINHIGRWHDLNFCSRLGSGTTREVVSANSKTKDAGLSTLSGEEKPTLTEQQVATAAGDRKIIGTTQFIDYVNKMDWEKIPAAKKHMSGLLGRGLTYYGQPVVEELKKRHPKTADLEPQTNVHMSANYTGWSSYTHGATTAYVRGNSASVGNYAEGGTRQYGMLMLYNRTSSTAMGVGHGGYSMLEVPGTTMPSLTEIDWNDEKYGFSIPTKSRNPHHLHQSQ